MVDYLEILRLKHLGYSQRQIIGSVGCSSHTIKDTWEAAQELNLQWPMPENTTNEELKTILFPNKSKPVQLFAEPDYAYIHGELAKSGVTLTLLWEEYRQKCYMESKTPYQYTQFAVKYNKWARSTKATMRIQHKPGDSMEVDWAGDTTPYYDPISGESHPAYLFIAVLPCSLYLYATVCSDMKLENWLNCHIYAFEYFGGVARLLIPDNCKNATTQNSKFDVVLNRSYQELAAHYGTAIVPARVRKPKDKSHDEAAVRMAETWILAALRNQKFFSLSEMREAVAEKLEELNTRAFTNRSGNRKTAYLEEELQYMLPLPKTPYEAAVWSVAKVPNDYVVTDGLNKYSVPYVLIGEKVDIKVTRNIVEVFYKGSKVASHKRMPSLHRDPIVKEEHMPQEHRKYLYYNADSFIEWATKVGPNTLKVVNFFLSSGKAPEQGYKSCASLNKLATRYSEERLEKACQRLLLYSSSPSVRNINSILKNGQDKVSTHTQESVETAQSNDYGLTRGANYYRRRSEQQ